MGHIKVDRRLQNILHRPYFLVRIQVLRLDVCNLLATHLVLGVLQVVPNSLKEIKESRERVNQKMDRCVLPAAGDGPN